MTAYYWMLGVAAIIGSLAQVFGGRSNARALEHLIRRADRVDAHLGLPPLEAPRLGFKL